MIHISFGGPVRVLQCAGKTWRFEDHPYCGPIVVKANGEPVKTQPGERSPFWTAVTHWYQQGKRIADGLCVWDAPPPPEVQHMGGRHYPVVASTADAPRAGGGA